MSRKRLISTMSFHAGRTTADAVPACTACNCASTSGTSFGECSVSSRSQSKPEWETISAVIGLHRLHHSPICSSPLAIACLNVLRGCSMATLYCLLFAHVLVGEPATTPDQVRGRLSPGHALNELHRDAAERPEIGMKRVALAGEHH